MHRNGFNLVRLFFSHDIYHIGAFEDVFKSLLTFVKSIFKVDIIYFTEIFYRNMIKKTAKNTNQWVN